MEDMDLDIMDMFIVRWIFEGCVFVLLGYLDWVFVNQYFFLICVIDDVEVVQ